MCGIVGRSCVSPPPAERLRELGERMHMAVWHRGPDGFEVTVDAETLLVHRRLAIIDLSPSGAQPLWNEDRTVAVIVNGEVYNFRDLRRDLEHRGHRFRGHSDSEVIVHLYEEHGIERCCRALEGMFAFALWDARRRELFLVRDRLGIKPLVIAEHAEGVTFGSTLPAVLTDPAVPCDFRPQAILAALKWGFVPSPWSAIKACRRVLPGSCVRIKDGRVRQEHQWWRDDPPPRDGDEGEVRRAIEEAVRSHLVADVPIGVLLSAGIDSGLVTAVANRLAPGEIEAWSVSHPGYPQDEFPEARRAADHFGTLVHEVEIGGSGLDEGRFDQMIAALDEPLIDASLVGLHAMYERIAPHRRVVLSGDGGDELFAGYDWHLHASVAPRWGRTRMFRALAPALSRLPNLSRRMNVVRDVARYVTVHPAHHYVNRFRLLSDQELASHGLDERSVDPVAVKAVDMWDRYSQRDPLERMLAVDRATLLVDQMLAKIDTASMAHSVEARVPLLADGVVAAAKALPSDRKRRCDHGKLCLRDWYREIGPPGLADRPKTGFNSPIAAWIRSPAGEFLRARSQDALAELGGRSAEPSDRVMFAAAVLGGWLELVRQRTQAVSAAVV
jgi:asparagine synthase (glutamine-hydrolysing)